MQVTVNAYEVIPAGIYTATLVALEEKENADETPRFENSKPTYYQWTFEIKGSTKTVEIRANSSTSFGTKSKAYGWACAILGRTIQPRESFDTDDLLGKPCKLTVKVEPGDNGFDRNRVSDILPMASDNNQPF